MRKNFLRLGSLIAMLAVALGAFASHRLKLLLTPEELVTFEIGVRYQFYHALALIAVSIFMYLRNTSLLIAAGWLFFFGMLFFSGSLYLLSFKEHVFQFPVGFIAPLTPLGGTLFIAGWILFFISSYQTPKSGSKST